MADSLTGLDDRDAFLAALQRARRAAHVAVVLVEIDDIAVLRAIESDQAGDRAVKGVAAALSGALRRGDELFRVGDGEFAAILAVSQPDEARTAGTRLRVALGRSGPVSVSTGVAIPQRGEDDDAVLARAARALADERRGRVA